MPIDRGSTELPDGYKYGSTELERSTDRNVGRSPQKRLPLWRKAETRCLKGKKRRMCIGLLIGFLYVVFVVQTWGKKTDSDFN